MNKYLHIGINWIGPVKSDEVHILIEKHAADWFKYGGNCWVVWTQYDASAWTNFLKPHIGDSYIVAYEIRDIKAAQGWLVPEHWQWFNKTRY